VRDAEEEIPDKYWIETSQFVKDDIDFFSKRVRIALMDDGVNHPKALHLFWKIRCRLDRSRGECKESPVNVDRHDHQSAVKSVVSNKPNKLVKDKQEKRAQEKREKQKRERQKIAQQKRERQQIEQQKQEEQALAKKKFAEQKIALENEKLERAKIEEELERSRTEREKLEKELLALGNKNKALQAGVSMQEGPQVSEVQDSELDSQEEPEKESRWWQIF
jgi:flagellar biosynthesis GTPase FlhF